MFFNWKNQRYLNQLFGITWVLPKIRVLPNLLEKKELVFHCEKSGELQSEYCDFLKEYYLAIEFSSFCKELLSQNALGKKFQRSCTLGLIWGAVLEGGFQRIRDDIENSFLYERAWSVNQNYFNFYIIVE